jgi:hypothetical protein
MQPICRCIPRAFDILLGANADLTEQLANAQEQSGESVRRHIPTCAEPVIDEGEAGEF